MNVNPIPEKINNFNVYKEGGKLVGVSAEVTLPSLEASTETISGAGIAGEYESPNIGHFGPISMEIPFNTLYTDIFDLLTPETKNITLRGSMALYDVAAGKLVNKGIKILVKGMPKGIDLGKMSPGKPMENKVPLEISYIKVDIDGKTVLEVDKLNFIYVVNGIDYLQEIRNQM
jgi:hypothetical protein